MFVTVTLVLMSMIFVGIYLVIKERKNSFICLIVASLFLFLALVSISNLVGEPLSHHNYQVNEYGEIKLF